MTRTSSFAAVILATLIALILPSKNGAASRGPVSISDLAPADEYFGRLKLSPLGIRHKIFSLKDDLHRGRATPDSVERSAEIVEDALTDWTTRFPRDPWLPATAWNLATLYEELPGASAHAHAAAMLQVVRDKFAQSIYAGYAVRDLAKASASPASSPDAVQTPNTPTGLVQAILAASTAPDAQHALAATQALEARYWALSSNGNDPSYARAAWELAASYERLPGEDARTRAIKLLALLVDRHSSQVYGRWALRDLARGLGVR